ncbi:MAG: sugar ABC transporter permease, partial [Clostridia bacterium]|nr:sugar ABC transporter permease [Clostridia bacterium]
FFIPVILTTGLISDIDRANTLSSYMENSAGIDDGSGQESQATQIISVMDVERLFDNMMVGTEIVEYVVQMVNNIFNIVNRCGVQMLIFLSGLQSISPAIYESCSIDGASGWETFWKITLPTLRSMILLNSIYTVVTLATGSTNPIIDLIYNATYAVTKGYSYAAAMTWMYTVIVAILLLITFLVVKEKKEKKSNDIWRRDVESARRGMQSKKVQKMLERGKAA